MPSVDSAHAILACRGCGASELIDLGACAPYPGRLSDQDAGRLLRCRQCALAQRTPCLEGDALIEAYRNTPAEDMDYRFEDNAAWSRARKVLLDRFGSDRSIAVLDIGCHTGAFLAALPESWRRHGIESAAEPVRIARERRGVNIVAERLETIGDDWSGRFDAITMFDVIEHLSSPAEALASVARLLRPGGLLILSSGDFGAWTWRWMGGGHWYLQTPLHLAVVSGPFLRYAAEKGGLSLIDLRAIPHRRATVGQRLHEAAKAVYWGLRQRKGIYRIPHRLLQSLPGLRDLRHLQSVPWTMSLKDHLLATYER